MNLIELKKLEGRRQAIIARQKDTGKPNHGLLERLEIERDMIRVAPALLDILSEIQPGDADEIDYAIQELSRLLGPDNVAETIEVLRRYLSMAQRMEEANRNE